MTILLATSSLYLCQRWTEALADDDPVVVDDGDCPMFGQLWLFW